MRRSILLATVVLLVTALAANVALALGSGPPSDDAYVDINTPSTPHDDDELEVRASNTACDPTYIVYLKWDLSDIPDGTSVHTATLTLTTSSASNSSGASITLYEAADVYAATSTPWEEEGLTYSNAPDIAVGTPIETQAAPTAGGQALIFSSTALRDYVNAQAAGDNVASFALRFSGGCPTGLTAVVFEDRESPVNGPHLQLLNTNAVRQHSFQASGLTYQWTVAGMLTILGLVTIGRFVAKRTE